MSASPSGSTSNTDTRCPPPPSQYYTRARAHTHTRTHTHRDTDTHTHTSLSKRNPPLPTLDSIIVTHPPTPFSKAGSGGHTHLREERLVSPPPPPPSKRTPPSRPFSQAGGACTHHAPMRAGADPLSSSLNPPWKAPPPSTGNRRSRALSLSLSLSSSLPPSLPLPPSLALQHGSPPVAGGRR